ncbi:unnamed protein product, partial [Closterium sp. Naga37s-1]
SSYSFAMYDNTDAGVLKQIYGPKEPQLESRSAFPFVLPTPTVVPPEHLEPFPENAFGRTFEAHCGFEGPYPKWDLVYAPMLLGLLVLLVAVLLSTVIAVLVRKKRSLQADVKEIQLCTAILERAERSKSEAVASTSHELRTPIIGMMGMIEELLDSPLEEWQQEDLRVARACAGETVELINRVLDLAKLQAGRLQLETLPCCLRRIVSEATATAKPGKNLQVTVHVDESVPETLIGDPSRLLQVMAELVASAMNNTAAGHIAIRLWCIPPPHTVSSPPPPTNAPTGATQASSEPPPAPSPWQELAGCVRRFPLPSHHSQAPTATRPPPPPAAPTGATQASSEPPPAPSSWQELAGCVRRFPPPTRLLCLPQRHLASHGGPVGNGGGKACSRDSMGSAEERQGGDGRLEEEVREWVEGACAVREEGEWIVVVACEDTGGGIPPEELWGLLDPHGLACLPPHDMHGNGHPRVMERIRSFGRADSLKGLGRADSWKGLGRLASWRQRERSVWDPLQRDRKAAAGPRWTPYPVRFLLSTSLVSSSAHLPCGGDVGGHGMAVLFTPSLPHPLLFRPPPLARQVAEMRGGMAVLSDASTGTTILLALPLGGGEDASSTKVGEEADEPGGAAEARERGLEEGPPSGAAALPQQRPAAEGARALVHAHTFPQAEIERAVGEAERVVRAVVAGRGVAVVDDNAVNRMVARRTLQGYGAHVLLLPSGEEALQALSSALEAPQQSLSSATPSPPIHLLLLDLHMPPGIDGSVPLLCPAAARLSLRIDGFVSCFVLPPPLFILQPLCILIVML